MKGFCKKNIIKNVFYVFFLLMLSSTVYAEGSYTINGVTVKYNDFYSSPHECWAYANNMYNKIWGSNFTSDITSEDNYLRNLKQEELWLDEEHLKEYVSGAALGSSLRICNSWYLYSNDGWGHSQIIVDKDEDGFTVVEGGLSAWPYCREYHYTWSEYVNTGWLGKKYAYIKYIKWPGAVPLKSKIGNDPVGTMAECYAEDGYIKLKGWAADQDDPKKALQVHVYVGDPFSTDTPVHALTAEKYCSEADDTYSEFGTLHGYEGKIAVDEAGVKPVYVFALNVDGGENVLLWNGEVEIPEMETAITETEKETTTEAVTENNTEIITETSAEITTEAAAEEAAHTTAAVPAELLMAEEPTENTTTTVNP